MICFGLTGNAGQIIAQQHVIVTNWNTLQEHAAQRRQLLQAANDYQRLMATVRIMLILCKFYFIHVN